jgi:hypothetical protein
MEREVCRDFHIAVPYSPGFGVVIDEDKLAFYSHDDRLRNPFALSVAFLYHPQSEEQYPALCGGEDKGFTRLSE